MARGVAGFPRIMKNMTTATLRLRSRACCKTEDAFHRPFVFTTPSQLRGSDYQTYFTDYLNTFGNESCFMPFYWARIHANGELIFCPGHPDIIAGNVFRDGFMESFNSDVAIKFRKHMLTNRLPICNRCCGLYMTNPARPFEQKARKRLGSTKTSKHSLARGALMITLTVLFIATLFLAYSNGANDNFKGVATLFGSGTTSYKSAITWATISTFAGSITSLFLAETLLKNFSGRGLVPNELAASPQFVLAVGLAAGLTVMLATLTGFPVSTTHGLVGALVGAGLTAVGTSVNFATLGTLFFLPLLASPLLAVGLGVVSYVMARGLQSEAWSEERMVCLR